MINAQVPRSWLRLWCRRGVAPAGGDRHGGGRSLGRARRRLSTAMPTAAGSRRRDCRRGGEVRHDGCAAARAKCAARPRPDRRRHGGDSTRHSAADVRKIADYYASRLDTAGIEAKGLAPIAGELAAIAAITDRRALADWLGRTVRLDDGTQPADRKPVGRCGCIRGSTIPYRYAAHLDAGRIWGWRRTRTILIPSPTAAAARAGLSRAYRPCAERSPVSTSPTPAPRACSISKSRSRGTHASPADTDDVFKTDNEWRRADFAARRRGSTGALISGRRDSIAAPNFVVWQPRAVIGGAKLVASSSRSMPGRTIWPST